MTGHSDIQEVPAPSEQTINSCPNQRWRLLHKMRQARMPWHVSQSKITKKGIVWILDNTAYQSLDGRWEAEFITSVFHQNSGVNKTSNLILKCLEKFGLISEEKDKARVQERLIPCLQSLLPGRIVKIDFNKKKRMRMKLGPSGLGGISSNVKSLPPFEDGVMVTSIAKVPFGTHGILKMKTQFSGPEGWMVISDIDDTIKKTQTANTMGFAYETFIAEATPIQGMPELYALIQKLIGPSPFFYLSASPYNLYSFLRDFRQKHFPHGTLILRDISPLDIRSVLYNFVYGSYSTETFKTARLKKIHSWLPLRKTICIGDSTKSDPEVYGEIYRTFPGWIKLILIRKVTDIAHIGVQPNNDTKRFEEAFKEVPDDHWKLFESPEECHNILNEVIRGRFKHC